MEKEKNVLRNKSIGTEVSDDEYAALEKLAEARGLTVGEWLRELVLAELIAHPADWSGKATAVPYAVFGDPQTLTLYSYVRNNPVTKTDIDGHCDPISCVMHVIEYISGHTEYIGIVEGNVRSNYNARIEETKASQGGQITSAQRTAIQQEARKGSTARKESCGSA
jgi:mobilization protein NikA